jgi:hypothetical protein
VKRWQAEEFAEDRSEQLARLIARTEEKERARAVLRARQNSRRDAKQHPAVEAAAE